MKTTNGLNISLGNTKVGDTPSVSLPAVITCARGVHCAKHCYALRLEKFRPQVHKTYTDNLDLYKSNPDMFFNEIIDFLNNLIPFKLFRWHVSGDIVDNNYLLGMVRVAKNCPNTNFLAFTKQFTIVNNYLQSGGTIPSNLNIVFSGWDNTFIVDNPFNLPTTWVNFKDSTKNGNFKDKKIFKCMAQETKNKVNCDKCRRCWLIGRNECVVFNQH